MKNVLVLLLVSSFLTILTTPTFAYVRDERAGIGAYNEERPLAAAAMVNNGDYNGDGVVDEYEQKRFDEAVAEQQEDTPVPPADAKPSDKGEFSGEF